MHGSATFPTWKVVLIAVFSVIAGVGLLAGGFVLFRRWKMRRDGGMVEKESLVSATE